MGQPVIVDNRPSGVIPGAIVATAPPDGYTLACYGISLWMAPFLQDDIPHDPVREFAPVTLVANSLGALVVYPGLPVKSASELIALAKATCALNAGLWVRRVRRPDAFFIRNSLSPDQSRSGIVHRVSTYTAVQIAGPLLC